MKKNTPPQLCGLLPCLMSTALLADPYWIQLSFCEAPMDTGYCLEVETQDDQHYSVSLPFEGDPLGWSWPKPQDWHWLPAPEPPLNDQRDTLATLLPPFLQQHCPDSVFPCLTTLQAERRWHDLFLPTDAMPGRLRRQAGDNETEVTDSNGLWPSDNYWLAWIGGTATLLVGAVAVSLIGCIVCFQVGKRRAGRADTSEGTATNDFQRWPPEISYPMPRNRPYFQGEFSSATNPSSAHTYSVLERPQPPGLQVYGTHGLTLERQSHHTYETLDHTQGAHVAPVSAGERQMLNEAMDDAFRFLDTETSTDRQP